MSIELLKTVWTNLSTPTSACPDVSLAHVFDVLTDALIETGFGEGHPYHGQNEVETWVVCYLAIAKTSMMSMKLNYAYKAPRFYQDGRLNEHGYPKDRPYDEVEADATRLSEAAEVAIRALIERGVVIEQDGELSLWSDDA